MERFLAMTALGLAQVTALGVGGCARNSTPAAAVSAPPAPSGTWSHGAESRHDAVERVLRAERADDVAALASVLTPEARTMLAWSFFQSVCVLEVMTEASRLKLELGEGDLSALGLTKPLDPKPMRALLADLRLLEREYLPKMREYDGGVTREEVGAFFAGVDSVSYLRKAREVLARHDQALPADWLGSAGLAVSVESILVRDEMAKGLRTHERRGDKAPEPLDVAGLRFRQIDGRWYLEPTSKY